VGSDGPTTVRWLTAFLDRTGPQVADAVRFWQLVTASTLSPTRGERGQFATFLPPDGEAYLRVQTLIEGPGGGHLDVHVADVDAAAARAVALGARARPLDDIVTLLSPAGLRWCLVPDDPNPDDPNPDEPTGDDPGPDDPGPDAVAGPRRPHPVMRADGHACLVDQVCLDVPPELYQAECAFWQAITGWPLLPEDSPEFTRLTGPAGVPLQLLLQRLDRSPAGGRATCHLDLACSDVAAEVALHETWGARVVARFTGWTTLVDPSGVSYCVTRRDPYPGT